MTDMNRVIAEIKEYNEMKKQLDAEIEKLKAEAIQYMNAHNTDEVVTDSGSRADSKLFFDRRYQDTVNDAIQDLLDREPLSWQPDTMWIDPDNNVLHLFNKNDRAHTERTINL